MIEYHNYCVIIVNGAFGNVSEEVASTELMLLHCQMLQRCITLFFNENPHFLIFYLIVTKRRILRESWSIS